MGSDAENTLPSGMLAGMKSAKAILAAPSEFIMAVDGETPVATKLRAGTAWAGVDTWGTLLKFSLKTTGKEATISNGNGGRRAMQWTDLGFEASLSLQHDRGMPLLRYGDTVSLWVDTGSDEDGVTLAEKRTFYVADVTADKGDDETAMYAVTVRHHEGFTTGPQALFRAVVDDYGRVKSWANGLAVDAAGVSPGSVLPTAPA